MNRPALETRTDATSRIVYTCWPFGGLLCGLGTMGIGVLLLADHYLAAPAEVLWGVGLILLGGAVVFWSHHRGDWT